MSPKDWEKIRRFGVGMIIMAATWVWAWLFPKTDVLYIAGGLMVGATIMIFGPLQYMVVVASRRLRFGTVIAILAVAAINLIIAFQHLGTELVQVTSILWAIILLVLLLEEKAMAVSFTQTIRKIQQSRPPDDDKEVDADT